MIPIIAKSARPVYYQIKDLLLTKARIVDSGTWQSIPTAGKPEMITHELEDVVIDFPIYTEELSWHRIQIGPNLPWADEHFERDRVCGEPLNPGLTWQDWPYANKANSFREELIPGGELQFNHTYAERYWPKHAGNTNRGRLPHLPGVGRPGIRYLYGDLNDVVDLLVANPGTRGAYLPVWFPEDTGIVHGGRTPCTLGYLFRMRNHQLSIAYYIRSCDFVRHYRDDVYLTVRLLLWVLQECRKKDMEFWKKVAPGNFLMHIGSLHVFVNDLKELSK